MIFGNYWDGGPNGRIRVRLDDDTNRVTLSETTITITEVTNTTTNDYTFLANASRLNSILLEGGAAGVGSTLRTFNTYDEGTWTPSIGGTATYTFQNGLYIKIGKLVYVSARLQINVIGTGSTTTVSGLPFTSNAVMQQSLTVSNFAASAINVAYLVGRVSDNNTTMTFSSTVVAADLSTVNTAIFQNTTRVDFSGTYISAN